MAGKAHFREKHALKCAFRAQSGTTKTVGALNIAR